MSLHIHAFLYPFPTLTLSLVVALANETSAKWCKQRLSWGLALLELCCHHVIKSGLAPFWMKDYIEWEVYGKLFLCYGCLCLITAKHLVVGLRTLQVSRASSHDKVDVEQWRVMESTGSSASVYCHFIWMWKDQRVPSIPRSRSCAYFPPYTEVCRWNDTRKHISQFNQVSQHIVHQTPPLHGIYIHLFKPYLTSM